MCRSASDSDVARSPKQWLARKLAQLAVGGLRLNHSGFLRTEFVQAIQPVVKVRCRVESSGNSPPKSATLQFRCGHGRLLWRARTFYTDEPDTVQWLDTMGDQDILWDVGANVGMYSIYAAKIRGCKVYAFEPEAQNYALLVDSIILNSIGDKCFPVCLAVAGRSGFGWLGIRYPTKGGAWNNFRAEISSPKKSHVADQSVFGATLDDLVSMYGFAQPTHLKIDVDGLEPEIIDGAAQLLGRQSLRSVLVEVDMDSDRHRAIPGILETNGLRLRSETPTGHDLGHGLSHVPTVNMIFSR